MSAVWKCRQCGAEHSEGTLEGLCPACSGAAQMANEPMHDGRTVVMATVDTHHTQEPVAQGRFGDYELLHEIAQGGMGVVYKARQVSLNRIVAVKMIRAGQFAREEDIKRFRVEAESTANLRHPNIVAIHEVGEEQGQQYFSMDYIEGQSLSQLIRQQPLSAKKAAAYVKSISEAIHYAHSKGILHRDLKPSNVLIDQNDQVQVMDFGLAKLLTGDSELTLSGTVMGSPSYMPPEQASGRTKEITVRSDVYSLGAILYEALSNRPPFKAETSLETLKLVVETEPISPRLLNPKLPKDLETICLKCLQKEPSKRYADAKELADELGHFIRGEPIRARPVGQTEKLWRWCKRKPALAGTSALALFAVIVGFAGVLWQWQRANTNARNEQKERQHAQASVTRLEIDRAEMLFDTGQSSEALAYLARVLRREPTNRVVGERIISALAHRNFCVPLFRIGHKTNVTSAEFSPDGHRVMTASRDGTARVWDGRTGQPMLEPFHHAAEVVAAHFSPDGARIVTTSLDKTARIWDAHTGQPVTEPLVHEGGVLCADFSPDGLRVATGSANGSMRLWNAATGALLGTTATTHTGRVGFVKFSSDGKWIVIASTEGIGRILNAANETEVAAFGRNNSGAVPFPSFSPDGTRIVTGPHQGTVDIIGTGLDSTNRLGKRLHNSGINRARFSPDGQSLGTCSGDSNARIWDAATMEAVGEVMRHGHPVNAIEFSPDGQKVVTGSRDRTARIWEARTGRPLSERLRHDADVMSVEFSSDGQRILSLCEGSQVWVWEVRSEQPLTVSLQHPSEVRKAVFSPDGERAATTTLGSLGSDNLVRLWDARRAIPLLPPLGGGTHDVQFSRDGRLLLAMGNATTVWDSSDGKIVGGPFENNGTSARFSPDGQLVLIGGGYGWADYGPEVKVWRISTGELVTKLSHETNAGFAQFSPDGQWVVTTSADRTARLWDWRTGKPLTEPLRHDGDVVWVDVSADSKQVVTISRDQTARIWQAGSGKLLHTLPHAEEPYAYNSVQFSPDGRLVVTAAGNTAQIWNSHTGRPITVALKHDGRVNSVRFSPDGKRLVTACLDSSARIWDVTTGHLLSEPLRHRARVMYAEFSPNGCWVITASDDGTAKIWELPILSSSPPPWLADWAEAVAGQRIDERNANQSVPFEELRRLREGLKRASEADEAVRWGRWFFAENSTRTISPGSSITVEQLVQQRVEQYTLNSLQQAVRLSPTNGLAQARLAFVTLTNEATPDPRLVSSVEWQSRCSLELSPNDSGAWRARAKLCDYLGRLAEALDAMDRATSLDPTNASFWDSKGLLCEKANRLEEAMQSYTKAIEVSGPWTGLQTLPARAYKNRSKLNRRLNRLAEAAADNLNSLNLPHRVPGTPATLLNLSLFYNNTEDMLPMGRQTLAGGREFDLRGAIYLGALQADSGSPGEVHGIPVAQKCRRLHFLHAAWCRSIVDATDGNVVGLYRLHYAGGQQKEIPIIYGENLRHEKLALDSKEELANNTKVAWVGAAPDKAPIRIFETTCENDRPDVEIETLDFISRRTGTAPILFAITAEP